MAFDPSGQKFYLGGGKDDNIHIFLLKNGSWQEEGTTVSLDHNGGDGMRREKTLPGTARLGGRAEGETLLIAHIPNNSIFLGHRVAEAVKQEIRRRPADS